MDARLDIPVPKVGRVKIGRQKVGVDHEWVMALTDWVFMERSVSSAFVPQRNVGVLVENSAAGERVVWSAGWFNDWFANDNSFSDNGNQYTARISVLPVDAGPQGDTVVQVGAGVFYKEAKNGKLQYRSRPEINQSDYFADTGKFAADHAVTSQFEAMAIKGRWQVFADGSVTPVSAAQAGNPLFYGGFAGVGYFLTQDHHGFNRREGYVGRFTPRSPFSLHGGGRGAWEVGGRLLVRGPDRRHDRWRPDVPMDRRDQLVPHPRVAAGVQLRLHHTGTRRDDWPRARAFKPHRLEHVAHGSHRGAWAPAHWSASWSSEDAARNGARASRPPSAGSRRVTRRVVFSSCSH